MEKELETINFVISIGNSDNKLGQKEWHHFVSIVDNYIRVSAAKIHFFGGSETYAPWQNVSWIGEIEPDDIYWLEHVLEDMKNVYRQDSIFVLYGEGKFI